MGPRFRRPRGTPRRKWRRSVRHPWPLLLRDRLRRPLANRATVEDATRPRVVRPRRFACRDPWAGPYAFAPQKDPTSGEANQVACQEEFWVAGRRTIEADDYHNMLFLLHL